MTPAPPSRPSLAARIATNRHFLIAAALLAVTAGWWLVAPNALRWFFCKPPVPWPKDLEVSADCRWITLPTQLGHYVRVDDEERPGEILLSASDLELLGIGTSYDLTRFDQRCSNWYVSRLYKDTRPPAQRTGPKYWRLDVTYFTGVLDPVAHVPENCLVATGVRIVGNTAVTFSVPAARSPWDRPFTVLRTLYEKLDPQTHITLRFVQYYVFCLNGRPETSWQKVRLTLTLPWVQHVYFAKIQFAPDYVVTDLAAIDRQAEEFMNAVLPAVLKGLPSAADVEALDAGSEARGP